MLLEKNSASYLQNAVAKASTLDGAIDVTKRSRRTQASGGRRKIDEVEYVGCFST